MRKVNHFIKMSRLIAADVFVLLAAWVAPADAEELNGE